MSEKERDYEFMVRNNQLYAVVSLPKRIVPPLEKEHVVCFSGSSNRKWKLQLNTIKYGTKETVVETVKIVPSRKVDKKAKVKKPGYISTKKTVFVQDKSKVVETKSNFKKIPSKDLDLLHSKCCKAFKEQFPLRLRCTVSNSLELSEVLVW